MLNKSLTDLLLTKLKKIELVSAIHNFPFLEKPIIKDKNETILKEKSRNVHLNLWYGSFKLDKDNIGVVVVWKNYINQKK